MKKSAPKSVIRRLPVYLRILDHLLENDVEIVSSREISDETGFTAEQIRKDLAFFGAFGTRGTGYNTGFLRDKILKIIGLDQKTNIIVVGAGHLGIALTRYNITKNPYVNVVAVFDNDPDVIGEKIIDVEVLDISKIKDVSVKYDVKVALLTVPSEQAQIAAEEVIKSGVTVIFNFALSKLHVPDSVYIHNADLSIELQSLIYYATNNKKII